MVTVGHWNRPHGLSIDRSFCRCQGFDSVLFSSLYRGVCNPVMRPMSHVSNFFHPPDVHCPPYSTLSGNPQDRVQRRPL